MNSIKIDLEKRTFVMFFVITFSLVFALILLEYQLVRYGIRQNEDIKINAALTSYQISRAEENNAKIQDMQIIASDELFLKIIVEEKYDNIQEKLENLDISIKPENLAIYSKARKIVYGSSWELQEKYVPLIFNNYSKSFHGQFYVSYGRKPYSLYYVPLYIEDEFTGILIYIEQFVPPIFMDSKLQNGFITTIEPYSDFSITEISAHEELKPLLPLFKARTEELKKQDILRLNSETAYGIVIDYNIINQPTMIYIQPYTRDVFLFAQQSVLIFTLILLAATIIMISLLGNWFGKTILQPVREVNEKMDIIAKDPTKIEPIKSNYVGVLGSMVKTFNFMNTSITNYSNNLREYKVISDNIDSGFFWLTDDFSIEMYNGSLLDILNKKGDQDITGEDLNDYLKLNVKEKQQVLEMGITIPQLEIFSGAARKFVLLKMMSVRSNGNIKIVGTITDITREVNERQARESLELELIKSNRLAEIGRRIEGIVHNINSPLNTILGYAQLMRKNNKDSKDLVKIIEAGKNISHLVKGLLNKAKADSSSMTRPVDINELIHQELELCNHNLFFKHYVDLELNLSETIPQVKAVYGDISLSVANIINNAIESLENRIDKFIKVETYLHDGMVAIAIEDTGVGIPEENREAIFEPYFTTKNREDGKGSGFGLGLAISKSVVDRYQGRIELISEENKGSRFIIYLPV